MSKVERLRERARAAEGRDLRAAIDAWLAVLKVQEEEGDANPDLSVYNRLGDLYLKAKDPARAADYYERGVDKYGELGFHNNAIALCNKVLRNAPGRPTTYLKLAQLYAAKGFSTEARHNFVEYAERMKRSGNIDHAFQALKQVADMSPDENLRRMLEDHMRNYGEIRGRTTRATAAVEPPRQPEQDVPGGPKRKTTSLVFLDLDEPPAREKPAAAAQAPEAPSAERPKAQPPGDARPKTPAPPPIVRAEPDFSEPEVPVELERLDVERTSLADDAATPAVSDASLLDGFVTTSFDFDEIRSTVAQVPALRQDDIPPAPVAPMSGLEPTAAGEEELAAEVTEDIAAVPEAPEAEGPVAEPSAPPPAGGGRRSVEVPPLELEPEFDAAAMAGGPEIDEEPLALDADGLAGWILTEDATGRSRTGGGRSQGFIDLGFEGGIAADNFSGLGSGAQAEAPSIEDLEAQVASDPDNADLHRRLGEALIEAGDRERGVEELGLAATGYETTGNLQQAQDLVNEILRLDPNSVRHRQRVVEYAYRAGDKDLLIEAYLELGDTLLRNNLPDKARAVYERVAEHDAGNVRARAALEMLTAAPATAREGRVSPDRARMRVRDEAITGTDFVDLGALVLDEGESHPRDTRMKIEDEEPTGDEERDFQEMLTRFKQGIDENIDETDFQSHYDLGVAFKEMGLLDEAIGEFQKALRAPDGKLRTSEALAVCFFDKGALTVAESILRRSLELPAGGDQERLGVLYWLGRTLEGQGRPGDAREYYGRVFAVDVRFMDVGERLKALARA